MWCQIDVPSVVCTFTNEKHNVIRSISFSAAPRSGIDCTVAVYYSPPYSQCPDYFFLKLLTSGLSRCWIERWMASEYCSASRDLTMDKAVQRSTTNNETEVWEWFARAPSGIWSSPFSAHKNHACSVCTNKSTQIWFLLTEAMGEKVTEVKAEYFRHCKVVFKASRLLYL